MDGRTHRWTDGQHENSIPTTKFTLLLGVTYFTLAYIGKNIEKSSCLKP